MKLPLKILVVLAVACWISAVVLFVIGNEYSGLTVSRLAAIPDALLAVVFTVLSANQAFKR